MAPRDNLSVLLSRFNFNTRHQKFGETEADFAEALKHLSRGCRYQFENSVIDTLIRDQFIVGLKNKSLQVEILKEGSDDLTLDGAVEISLKKSSPVSVDISSNSFNEPTSAQSPEKKKTRKPFNCELCSGNNPGFNHERNLLRHMKRFHQDDYIESRVLCEVCNQSFFSGRGLRRHISLTHNNHQTPVEEGKEKDDKECELKISLGAGPTANEVSTEESKAVHRCQSYLPDEVTCPAVFTLERNLIKHLKQCHKDVRIEGRRDCEQCQAIFFSDLALRQHFTKHHLNLADLTSGAGLEDRRTVVVKTDPFQDIVTVLPGFGPLGPSPTKEALKPESALDPEHLPDVVLADELAEDAGGPLRGGDKVIAETFVLSEDGTISSVKEAPFSIITEDETVAQQQQQQEEPVQVVELEEFRTDFLTETVGLTPDDKVAISIVTSDVSANQAKRIEEEEAAFKSLQLDRGKSGLCFICGKTFQDPLQHYRNVHAKERPFKCHLCPFSHPLKGHVAQHIRQSHLEAKFVCEVCGSRQRSKQAVKDHIAMVHEGKRPWPCPVQECGKTFAKKQYVDEHVAVTHRGEAPFTCKFCPQTFTRRRAMLMHRRTVHENMWFDCQLCGKRFKEKCAVENHVKLVHENKTRYNCPHCLAGFRSIKPFKEHMSKHKSSVEKGSHTKYVSIVT